jgi:hypothetical protein
MRYLREDPDDIRIVLLADKANMRPDLPVEYIELSPETLHEWHMQGTYKHAIQAYALHYGVRRFNAPTILIDGDTIHGAHPRKLFERISPGRVLMHAREGALAGQAGEWPEYERIIHSSEGKICGMPIGRETVMFNAGVIGLHPQDADLLGTVKDVMHQIREISDVFTAVQLAASVVFGCEASLGVCDDLVEHYWGGPRDYYQYQINRMFPDVLAGGGLQRLDIPLPPLNGMPKGSPLLRIAAKAKGIHRNAPRSYQHAFMAYLSALALRRRNPEMANVWAARAINVLAWAMTERLDCTESDFRMFSAQKLSEQGWLRPEVRKKWIDYWVRTIGPSDD